jgi:arylsulfatase A-like enzyme
VLLHNTTVYEEMIHVPLLVRLPGGRQPPGRFGGVVELRSIFPTVCEALGVASCPAGLAPSLFELVRAGPGRPGLARTWAQGKEGSLVALVLPRYKLIARVEPLEPVALYDLGRDPRERWNLRSVEPERVREALAWLVDRDLDVFGASETTVEPATRGWLEALGYTE